MLDVLANPPKGRVFALLREGQAGSRVLKLLSRAGNNEVRHSEMTNSTDAMQSVEMPFVYPLQRSW